MIFVLESEFLATDNSPKFKKILILKSQPGIFSLL